MSPEGRDGDDDSTPSRGEEEAAAEGENEASLEHAAAVPCAAAVDTCEDDEDGDDGSAEDDAPPCAAEVEVEAAHGEHDGEHDEHEHEDEDGTSTCQAQWDDEEEEEGHRRTHPVHVIESSRRTRREQPGEPAGRRIRNARNNIHPALPLPKLLHLAGEEPAAGPSRREAAAQLSRQGRRRRRPHRAHRPNAWSPPPRRSLHRPRCYQREEGRSAPWWARLQ